MICGNARGQSRGEHRSGINAALHRPDAVDGQIESPVSFQFPWQ